MISLLLHSSFVLPSFTLFVPTVLLSILPTSIHPFLFCLTTLIVLAVLYGGLTNHTLAFCLACVRSLLPIIMILTVHLVATLLELVDDDEQRNDLPMFHLPLGSPCYYIMSNFPQHSYHSQSHIKTPQEVPLQQPLKPRA